MVALSAEFTTMPRGKPPAAEDVETTNIGLLKSSNEEDASIKTSSFDCIICPCTLDISRVHTANFKGSSLPLQLLYRWINAFPPISLYSSLYTATHFSSSANKY